MILSGLIREMNMLMFYEHRYKIVRFYHKHRITVDFSPNLQYPFCNTMLRKFKLSLQQGFLTTVVKKSSS